MEPASQRGPSRLGSASACQSVTFKSVKLDDSVQKSCWGLTAKAAIGFVGLILLAWLISGGETVAIVTTG